MTPGLFPFLSQCLGGCCCLASGSSPCQQDKFPDPGWRAHVHGSQGLFDAFSVFRRSQLPGSTAAPNQVQLDQFGSDRWEQGGPCVYRAFPPTAPICRWTLSACLPLVMQRGVTSEPPCFWEPSKPLLSWGSHPGPVPSERALTCASSATKAWGIEETEFQPWKPSNCNCVPAGRASTCTSSATTAWGLGGI